MNKSNRIGFMQFSLCLNKRGDAGEMVMMLWRLFLIAIIAFTVLGVSSFIYSYDINVRDVEARIMTRNIVNCLVQDSVMDVSNVSGNDEMLYSIISYCGYFGDLGRYYVRVEVTEADGKGFLLVQGDSGAKWVREMSQDIKNYELYSPGRYRYIYDVSLKKDEGEVSSGGKITVEVLVNADV